MSVSGPPLSWKLPELGEPLIETTWRWNELTPLVRLALMIRSLALGPSASEKLRVALVGADGDSSANEPAPLMVALGAVAASPGCVTTLTSEPSDNVRARSDIHLTGRIAPHYELQRTNRFRIVVPAVCTAVE